MKVGSIMVSLPKVRQGLGRMDALLHEHPELAERTRFWLAGELPEGALLGAEDALTKTTPLGVRLDARTLARLDRYAASLRAAAPGLSVGRTDAVRVLLHRGLDAWEKGSELEPLTLAAAPPPPDHTRPRDAEAWAAALAALEALAATGMSQREIARRLNAAGHTGPHGGAWRQSLVSVELRRLQERQEGGQ